LLVTLSEAKGLYAAGSIIRVGKHRFLRIVDADKHPQP